MADSLLFTIEDGVAKLTLNRPEAANALDIDLGRRLMDAAIRCDEDPAIRSVLLTGAGDRFFCAGGDLKSFQGFEGGPAVGIKHVTAYLHAAIQRFTRMDPPLVVAVNGTAAGAGVSLAAVGDIVLAGAGTAFTLAYTAAGLSPDGSSTFFLPRAIGMRRTQELMLTNRKFTAEEAENWGLITRSVGAGEALAEAGAIAAQLAQGPTRAYGGVKKLLADAFSTPLETQMEWEAQRIAEMARTGDGQEGMAAFAEKRKPEFRGS